MLVTSTIPGEGKTMVSANLAAAFAAHGRRVLLVDCDLRRPMLHERLGQTNDRGILRWYHDRGDTASEESDRDLLGIREVAPHFHLLTSGGRSHHPTPLFEAPEFGTLIAHLKTQYDLVLIDTPPLGAVSDALYISRFADEFIYVCRFNRALRRHVRLNLRMLRTGPCRGLGIVLNDISLRSLGYYSDYRYYSSYNKYYGQAA
jgi:capsular exopolysaccharide synthesis family protein